MIVVVPGISLEGMTNERIGLRVHGGRWSRRYVIWVPSQQGGDACASGRPDTLVPLAGWS